jgi:hypothetical protein
MPFVTHSRARYAEVVHLTRLVVLIAVVAWISGTVALAQTRSAEMPGIEAPAAPETPATVGHRIPLQEVPD